MPKVFVVRLWLVILFGMYTVHISLAQSRPPDAAVAEASYSYKFENQRFYIPLIEVNLTPDGSGELRFKRGESDEVITLKLKLLPQTLTRMRQLYDETKFITSTEEYQDKRDFSHLGWVTLSARQGEQSRNARFNHTMNPSI